MILSLRSSPPGSRSSFPLQKYFSCKSLWEQHSIGKQWGSNLGKGNIFQCGWQSICWDREKCMFALIQCWLFLNYKLTHSKQGGREEERKKTGKSLKTRKSHFSIYSETFQSSADPFPVSTISSIPKPMPVCEKAVKCNPVCRFAFYLFCCHTDKEYGYCIFTLKTRSSLPIACRDSMKFDTADPFL